GASSPAAARLIIWASRTARCAACFSRSWTSLVYDYQSLETRGNRSQRSETAWELERFVACLVPSTPAGKTRSVSREETFFAHPAAGGGKPTASNKTHLSPARSQSPAHFRLSSPHRRLRRRPSRDSLVLG